MIKRHAFTLIELLVVIAIIAVLATLAVSALSRLRAQARDTVRKAELDQLTKGLELYRQIHGVYPCGEFTFTAGGSGIRHTGDDTVSGFGVNACHGGVGDVPGFLNGSDGTISNLFCEGTPKAGGLYHEEIINTACPKDALGSGDVWVGDNMAYRYYATPHDRQSYVLETWLETDTAAMLNDGGCCKVAYEVGPGVGKIPSQCRNGAWTDFTC